MTSLKACKNFPVANKFVHKNIKERKFLKFSVIDQLSAINILLY